MYYITWVLLLIKLSCNHVFSIGSLGEKADEPEVAGIIIRDSKISNADNGVRIKTWPNMNAGVARDITFDNIVMRNVSRPILIDQSYCANGKGCPENMVSIVNYHPPHMHVCSLVVLKINLASISFVFPVGVRSAA